MNFKNIFKPIGDEETKPMREGSVEYTKKDLSGNTVVLKDPCAFSESVEIADYLLNNAAVLVNCERLNDANTLRIVDYLNGVIHAIDGDAQKIGDKIYLFTPSTVDIEGSIGESQESQNYDDEFEF